MLDSININYLWAKKNREGKPLWLPLVTHLLDSAEIAKTIWRCWVSDGVKQTLAQGTGNSDLAERLFVFLMASHDLGKATPVFQATPSNGFSTSDIDVILTERIAGSGLPMKAYAEFGHPRQTPHALASQCILTQAGCNESVAVILGAHHGKPPNASALTLSGPDVQLENYYLSRKSRPAWLAVQEAFINLALSVSGFENVTNLPIPTLPAQVLYSGLTVMADWIASNERLFPLIDIDDNPLLPASPRRAAVAWRSLNFPTSWEPDNQWMQSDLYQSRFHISSPYPMQSAVVTRLRQIVHPGILVLEAPMGRGKTEAALVMAEALAQQAGRTGVFFALPTQATSNAVFSRISRWASALELMGSGSIKLAHGKAYLNQDYQELCQAGKDVNIAQPVGARVHSWFDVPKKALLADFVVGTIDQLLMAALRQKHVMLRHLGLANKVVIIDECHAYDAYMSQYLMRALRWLAVYDVPVIVLSATLPGKKRQMLVEAYLGRQLVTRQLFDPFACSDTSPPQPPPCAVSRNYPLLTYTDSNRVCCEPLDDKQTPLRVSIRRICDDDIIPLLRDLLQNGGYAGIVVNTVRRAQAMAHIISEAFGSDSVLLLHSRFLAPDRTAKEQQLLAKLGVATAGVARHDRYIVIGTQVIEQSLDIDFDVLITDLCPMDLLLQRIGRLHRHQRKRPTRLLEPVCFMLGASDEALEAGSVAVYCEYPLMRTLAFLPESLILPTDIPSLVQTAYDDDTHPQPEPPGYREAKVVWEHKIALAEQHAGAYRIDSPDNDPEATMVGWLDMGVNSTEQGGAAAVRDSDPAIEVLVLATDAHGQPRFLP